MKKLQCAIIEVIKQYPTDRIPYDYLTLYLEKQGYNREAISKKILDLIRKDVIDWIQGWSAGHPIYEGREYREIGFIWLTGKEPRTLKEDTSYMENIKKLGELSKDQLIDLQNDIKNILNKREIDINTISYTIEHRCKLDSYIRYPDLTLYLEMAGFRRKSISKEVIHMAGENMFKYSTGLPLEKETPQRPLSPVYEGRHYPIYYIFCK